MSTRTIEPIHIVLPDADGGYYRFGDLPRLIADALYLEHPDDDDEAQELQWMKHAIDGVEKYKRDLARAAGLTDGEPGYLHVVENSASKPPLELRTGAVLDAGLVHLDWLNEWGESRKPQYVFSMLAQRAKATGRKPRVSARQRNKSTAQPGQINPGCPMGAFGQSTENPSHD